MLKAIESTLFMVIGVAVGVLFTNLDFFLGKTYLVDLKSPIFLGLGAALILASFYFKQVSRKIFANGWAGAFSAYISVPITKIFLKVPMLPKEVTMVYVSVGVGLVISIFLFKEAEKRQN